VHLKIEGADEDEALEILSGVLSGNAE